MSRTDKDAPDWVRAEWYEPWHWCRPAFGEPCTLPTGPTRRRPVPIRWRSRWVASCEWVPAFGPNWRWRSSSAPGWFVHHIGYGQERTTLRAQLGRARQEWNGSGDTDAVPDVFQHRHRAKWLWD